MHIHSAVINYRLKNGVNLYSLYSLYLSAGFLNLNMHYTLGMVESLSY